MDNMFAKQKDDSENTAVWVLRGKKEELTKSLLYLKEKVEVAEKDLNALMVRKQLFEQQLVEVDAGIALLSNQEYKDGWNKLTTFIANDLGVCNPEDKKCPGCVEGNCDFHGSPMMGPVIGVSANPFYHKGGK